METPEFSYEVFQLIVNDQIDKLIGKFHKGFNLNRYYVELRKTLSDDYEDIFFNGITKNYRFGSSFNYLENGIIFTIQDDRGFQLGINIEFETNNQPQISRFNILRGVADNFLRGVSLRQPSSNLNTTSLRLQGQHHYSQYFSEYGLHEKSNQFFLLSHEKKPYNDPEIFFIKNSMLNHAVIDRRMHTPSDRLSWEIVTMEVLNMLYID